MPLRVSVIVATFRRPGELASCLDGLDAQRQRPDEVLVAVRDDDPETRQLAAAWEGRRLVVRAIAAGTCNASEARNRCLTACHGDIVAVVDDDVVPRRGWLEAICGHFETDAAVGGVGGPDWHRGQETPAVARPAVVGRVQWWGRRIGNHHRGSNDVVAVEWLKGANMAFRREAIRDIAFGRGLRGSGAQFAEDVGVSLRVRRRGWLLRYDPAIAVDHFPGHLMAGGDHRNLADRDSLADAAYNETIVLLDYLPAFRRAVFLCWALLVGTRLLPGLVAACALLGRLGPAAFRRGATVMRARRSGWRDWRAAQRASTLQAPEVGRERVCLVTHLVTRHDGQGRVNYELAKYLARQGHAVTLVASAVGDELAREAGVSWIRIPMPSRCPSLVRWGLFAIAARWKLRARVRRQFDIVHLNGAIAPLPADVNTSHFVHARWQAASPERHRRLPSYQRLVTGVSSFCERRAYHHAQRVVAVSEVVRRSLCTDVGVAPDATEVIYTGVDTAEFRPHRAGEPHYLRELLQLTPDAFVLLFVGDAKSSRKNLDLPLRALADLAAHCHLVVVGEARGGPYTAMARELGVDDRTHFLGPRHEIARYYRDADALICAAHYEPASLVLFEAMASGVPVIATRDVGNAAMVVEGHNGFLLESGDDVAMTVDVLRRLERDDDLGRRVGRAARETVEALSWERMGRGYEALYRRVAAAAPRTTEVAA
ncbi:MAG TPA: glycosyltransferase [Gemmatimonadales bacterium]|nr:glycosyltransferase [Gemmatimonadales bacterium]